MEKLPLFEDFIPVGFGTNSSSTYSLGASPTANTGYNMNAIVGPVMEVGNCVAKEAYAYEANDNPDHKAEAYIKEAKHHINQKIDEAYEGYLANESSESEVNEAKISLADFYEENIDNHRSERSFIKAATKIGFKESDVKKLLGDVEQGGDSYIALSKDIFNESKRALAQITNESVITEAMVQVAGKSKPSGANVLAILIVKYLDDNQLMPSNANKKKITRDIMELIMDSTF